MAQTISRIVANSNPATGVYFIADNSGRNIVRNYATFSNTSGSVTFVPNGDLSVFNLPSALTGALTINVSATYSTGTNSYSWRPQVCDEVQIYLQGGASPYVVTFGSNIKGSVGTFSAAANVPVLIRGIFTGTEFVATHTVASA